MTSHELALREATQSAVQQFQNDEFAQQIAAAVPEGVSPRQLLRAAATAVLEDSSLADPALRRTLLQATLRTAQDGLLPDGREATFVVYKTKDGPKVQYLPMVGGMRKIAAEHGWALEARVVCEQDHFDPDFDAHKANWRPPRLGEDRGEPIGAYAIASHRDGRRLGPLVMAVSEIEKVRGVSRAKDKGPWVDWWDRMAEKTVAKRLFKDLALDPGDKRIAGILTALDGEGEQPVAALYGPERQHRPARGNSSRPTVAVVAGEGRVQPPSPAKPAFEGAEPTDEELDQLAAAVEAEAETLEGEATDEDEAEQPTFPIGKHVGKTILELYESGPHGRGYIKWAVESWQSEPMRSALDAFAADHPDVQATAR